MRNYSGSFAEAYKIEQGVLSNKLIENNVPSKVVTDIVNSGYYMIDKTSNVFDSFYGTEWSLQANYPFSSFLEMINNRIHKFPFLPAISSIKSIEEIPIILSQNEHSKWCLENGLLSFRGQTKEYMTKRDFPNLAFANQDGDERLIIPGLFRKYKEDFQQRILDEKPHWFFETILADDFIYYGIDVESLKKNNYEQYGLHTISDLADFPDNESQEYYRRWRNVKVNGSYYPDLGIVFQHYGIHTYGLDITFDFKTAAFFATNHFKKAQNGKADFTPIEKGQHQGVIYCFYFRTPTINQTRDLIKEAPSFQHMYPTRPVRQNCALPFFHYSNFNEAVLYCHHIFYLESDFSDIEMPHKTYLFPGAKEDEFYHAILEIKKKNNYFKDFVEYEFA